LRSKVELGIDTFKVALDSKTSKRIFSLAKEQQDELAGEDVTEEPHISAFTIPHTKRIQDDDNDGDEDDREMDSGSNADEAEDIFVRANLQFCTPADNILANRSRRYGSHGFNVTGEWPRKKNVGRRDLRQVGDR
jgi:hypothetical protein